MSQIKKVGIMTLHRANNYGAMLQAYALSIFLKEIGYSPFIVNYYMDSASAWTYLKHPMAFLGKLVGKKVFSLEFVKAKLSDRKGKTREDEFVRIFEEFREEYLPITKRDYNYKNLATDAPDAYAFIVGSDQVWAADFVFSSSAFLLGFAGRDTKKISYAASFGKARMERYLQPVFKAHIREFDSVSVREKSGVDLVHDIAGVEATHVVDPTLLLSDYSDIIDYSLVPEGDYIFSYRLGQSEALIQSMNEALEGIAETKQLAHYVVSTNSPMAAQLSGEPLRPTPGQLLGLIEKANFFATNSFHGTVFAVLLRTDFLTFARDSAADKQNLRLTELLSCLGLKDRYCAPGLELKTVLQIASARCDFEPTFEALEDMRNSSGAFLKQALEA